MKPLFAVFILFSLNACQSEPRVETNVPVNKANPAAVYCHQQGENSVSSKVKTARPDTVRYRTGN